MICFKPNLLPRENFTEDEARELALEFFDREPDRPVLIGEVCLWIKRRYGYKETELLLDKMVGEGILRHATQEELDRHRYQIGYYKEKI